MAVNLPYQQQDPWALPTMDQYLQQQAAGQNPVFQQPMDSGYVQQDMAVAPAPGVPQQSPDYSAAESLPEDAFARPYSDEEMVNPRNLLWAGILSDLGNYVGSGGRQPMGQTGLKMMMQGHQYNNRLKGANAAAKQRHWQNQQQVARDQANIAHRQREYDYRAGRDTISDNSAAAAARSAAAQRAIENARAASNDNWARQTDIAGQWQTRNLPNGQQESFNPLLEQLTGQDSAYTVKATTTLDDKVAEVQREAFVAAETAAPAAAEGMATVQGLLDYATEPGADYNTGSLVDKAQQVWGRWTGNTLNTAQGGRDVDMTERLQQYLTGYTLDNAASLKGSMSDADIALLKQKAASVDTSSDRAVKEFLYDDLKARERGKIVHDARRAHLNEYGSLNGFDEEAIVSTLRAQHDKERDVWLARQEAEKRLPPEVKQAEQIFKNRPQELSGGF